ncbi:uncharacterized protein LOC113305963 [Papaver somniferum]|uniref:uncharacterized protein LOC113305963 n=1 Tax=Papaver somniferum TaxID=3469 RepID=UPI000E70457E|nr:uncharacterized protein LOC113305963 [Papaver somniferum]
MDLPWMLIGDFNTVLSVDEKMGGGSLLRVAMQDFHEMMSFCSLAQAPSSGLQDTWCNNRAGVKRIICTLDRALCNVKWFEKYPTWSYKVGVRSIFDHSPLMGSCVMTPKPKNAPFRVLKFWLEHEDFKRVIKEVWTEEVQNPVFVFMKKMKTMKIRIKERNWSTFGDIRIKLVEAEKEVLKATINSDKHPSNISLLNNLEVSRGNPEIVTQQHHSTLQQKARVQWLKDGATNTRFFHTIIKLRQTVNAITELEDDAGTIISDQAMIANSLENHFKDKFKFKYVNFMEGIFDAIPEVVNSDDTIC